MPPVILPGLTLNRKLTFYNSDLQKMARIVQTGICNRAYFKKVLIPSPLFLSFMPHLKPTPHFNFFFILLLSFIHLLSIFFRSVPLSF